MFNYVRIYNDTLTSSTIKSIESLDAGPAICWTFVKLLLVANASPVRDGGLWMMPGFPHTQVTLAIICGVSADEMSKALEVMVDNDLIDHDDQSGLFLITNWEKYQYSPEASSRTPEEKTQANADRHRGKDRFDRQFGQQIVSGINQILGTDFTTKDAAVRKPISRLFERDDITAEDILKVVQFCAENFETPQIGLMFGDKFDEYLSAAKHPVKKKTRKKVTASAGSAFSFERDDPSYYTAVAESLTNKKEV